MKHRHVQSLSSLNSVRNSKRRSGEDNRRLTTEQTKIVKKATINLTAQQKEMLHQRQEKISAQRDNSVSSRGEGTSKRKGKTIDPREWGNVNMS